MPQVLMHLMDDLVAGRLKVVDLPQPLGPGTPVIELPPIFAASPGLTVAVISRYDERGPAWYWNTLHLGEHTGTHFDAPVHWITGKDLPDNTCDRIPVQRFVGPACVIDVTSDVAANEDFLLMPEHVVAWEKEHGKIPKNSWVLLRTGWSMRTDAKSFLNVGADGPHSPGFHKSTSELLAHDRDILGVGVETVGTDAGQAGRVEPPLSNPAARDGAGEVGVPPPPELGQPPPAGARILPGPLPPGGGG